MKKSLESLSSNGGKLQKQVIILRAHNISITFVCGISKRDGLMDAVKEAQDIMSCSNGDILEIAGDLSRLKQKYKKIGYVEYCLSKPV